MTAGAEIPKGYKLTEVGVIPEDWRVEALGPHVDIASGESPSRFRFDSAGIPYFKVDQLNNNSKYLSDTPYLIASSRKVVRGSLIFPKRGASILLNKVRVLAADSFMDTNLMALTPKDSVHSEFLFYALTHIELWRIADITSIPQINNKHIVPLLVPLPPTKAEQKSIAEALSDADALIESLEQLLAKKRQLKQGAMQELLTAKKRLPGFSGEWEVKRLRQMVQTPVTDGPHLTPRFLGDGIPFLSVNNLVDNKIDLSDLRFISAGDHAVFSRKCMPRKGDVLLGKAASVGKVAIVDTEIEFNIWSPIALIRVSSDDVARFVYYQLQSASLLRQIVLLTNSSSQGNIGMGDIGKLIFSVPSKSEQTAIAAILSDMDAEIAALEGKLAKARRLKQGMMQELLTGRIRLRAEARP